MLVGIVGRQLDDRPVRLRDAENIRGIGKGSIVEPAVEVAVLAAEIETVVAVEVLLGIEHAVSVLVLADAV